jgi:GTP-binding protein
LIAQNRQLLQNLVLDEEEYEKFKSYVESKGYRVFPLSAPINQGVKDLLAATAEELQKIALEPEEEDQYEYFDFDAQDEDEDYREIYASREGDVYLLTGKQLEKIFNSTNFNDIGSLRYLYKYIEKNGAIEKLKEMGLQEGDTIRVIDYDFEYFDE